MIMNIFDKNKRHIRKLRRNIRRNDRYLKVFDACITNFESEITAAETGLKEARKIRSEIICETDQLRAELRKAEENLDNA